MKLTIKICLGLLILMSLSSAHAVLVSRFTVDRDAGPYNPEETLVGKFKFRDGLTAGLITDADIVSFKWLNGEMFGFDYSFWNYFYPPRLQAVLNGDGSIMLGDNGQLEIFSAPPLDLVVSYVYLEIYARLPYTDPEAVCFTDDYAFMRCDGGQEDGFSEVDIAFTPLRRVLEPTTGLLLSIGLLGIIGSRKLRLRSFN